MSKWLLRGLVFAALMVIIRLVQGALINVLAGQALWISVVLVTAFAVTALIWGLIDGRGDARANADPDRRGDWAMTWLLAGLFAGLVSGFVAWVISLFYKNVYVEGLLNEITTFAAFTALLTFVFAIVGVSIGRMLVDRKAPPLRRQTADGERADTDVFEAVRDDDTRDDTRDETPVHSGAPGSDQTTPVDLEKKG